MKKYTFLTFVFALAFVMAGAQPSELIAEYGPPEEANTWEKFTIPLTAETFNVDEADFEAAMANITSFWIRTEMHTGTDVGGIDNVQVGPYFSDFTTSSQGWSSGGDGTMAWIQDGGYEDGFLQISDWATGEWHWLIAPSDWAGDWSDLIGTDIEFWYKTNQPSYNAEIKLTTEPVDRLVINTPVSSVIPPNDSIMIEVEVLPAPESDLTVSFSSSETSCVMVPESVVVPAGTSLTEVYFSAAPDATLGCESVVEATAPDYLTSRTTLRVEEGFGISEDELAEKINIYPNPNQGIFNITTEDGLRINRALLFDVQGNLVREFEADVLDKPIDMSRQAKGLYFLHLYTDKHKINTKLMIE